MSITVKCENCSKLFDIAPSRYSKSKTKIFNCSRKCDAEFRKSMNPNYVECCICGKSVYKKPREIRKSRTNQFCCSYECLGILRASLYLGENNPNYGNTISNPMYKGNEYRMYKNGYYWRRVFNHPFATDINRSDDYGFIREHRYVVENNDLSNEFSIEVDGKKYLSPLFEIHHINEIKTDNRIENLQILTKPEHAKLHCNFHK